MNHHDLDDLKAEFDKFVREKCTTDEKGNPVENEYDAGDAVDDEPVPAFVDELENKLLAPVLSGVYLSRIDIKRISQALDESLPIKERKKMIKALFRHTTSKEWLRGAFDEINNHMDGRILIYRQLGEAFPATKAIFDEHIAKAEKTKRMFDQIVADFEEIEPTDEPMMV
ncbi:MULTISPECIES: hypothetical protein [Sulfurimonas]|uniref:Uncharacterized protein n=1 Tax=Sulfurimonas diazotrophicus TaxID=3131939 RepID=A0ABZ3HE30_9BACT